MREIQRIGIQFYSYHTESGPGFSVLDITKPDYPIHMYSIYNDRANSRVLHANVNGAISSYDYTVKI